MDFSEILPRTVLLRRKMKVEGVNLVEDLPERVRVASALFTLMLEMYLILNSWVFLLSISNYVSLSII